MRFRIPLALASISLLTLCGWVQVPPSEALKAPTVSQPAPAPWYESEIRAFEEADKVSPPAPGQVLFIGSSSVRMWTTLKEDVKPAPVLNRGFGGSRTADVMEVFDRIVLPYKPSAIVYYCGDNDLGMDNTDSQAVADGFIVFVRRARKEWPAVQVMYIAIKPSVQRWKNWEAMKKTNEIVREYCEKTPGATYLDIVTPALQADGKPHPSTFREDGLHLNAKGYAIWANVIRGPVVEAWEKSKR